MILIRQIIISLIYANVSWIPTICSSLKHLYPAALLFQVSRRRRNLFYMIVLCMYMGKLPSKTHFAVTLSLLITRPPTKCSQILILCPYTHLPRFTIIFQNLFRFCIFKVAASIIVQFFNLQTWINLKYESYNVSLTLFECYCGNYLCQPYTIGGWRIKNVSILLLPICPALTR